MRYLVLGLGLVLVVLGLQLDPVQYVSGRERGGEGLIIVGAVVVAVVVYRIIQDWRHR
jgi:hypothetical protein